MDLISHEVCSLSWDTPAQPIHWYPLFFYLFYAGDIPQAPPSPLLAWLCDQSDFSSEAKEKRKKEFPSSHKIHHIGWTHWSLEILLYLCTTLIGLVMMNWAEHDFYPCLDYAQFQDYYQVETFSSSICPDPQPPFSVWSSAYLQIM